MTDLPHSDEIIPATVIQATLDRMAQEITALMQAAASHLDAGSRAELSALSALLRG